MRFAIILPPGWRELLPRNLRQHLLLTLLLSGVLSLCLNLLGPAQWLEARLFDMRGYFASQERELVPGLHLLALQPDQQQELLQALDAIPAEALDVLGLDVPVLSAPQMLKALEALSQRKGWRLVLSASPLLDKQGRLKGLRKPLLPDHLGLSYYPVDLDGRLRRLPLQLRYRAAAQRQVQQIDSFALAVYRASDLKKRPRLPLMQYFNYPAPQHVQPVLKLPQLQAAFSAAEARSAAPAVLLIAEADLAQAGKTPFDVAPTRLSMHAYAVSGLLQQQHYTRPALVNALLPLCLSLAGLLTLWLTLRWGRLMSGLAVLTLWLSALSLNILCFRYLQLWLDLLSPSLCLLASAACVMVLFERTEGQARQRLYSTFRRHLPDQKVRALMDKAGESLAQNERRVVTVMFTDIQGFSQMSEKLPSDQIIRILNEYLTAMTEIIFANQGSLDKYMGDGIMAVYGNIGSNNPKQDAYYAVKTALEMQDRMAELQKKWMNEGLRPIQIRIGINTGEALVGHVGHPDRKEVTVIGDTVNTTSRIEKLNKPYHTHILISHSTYEYVKEYARVQPLGEEQLKGKTSSVMVYEVRGWKAQPVA